MVPVFHAHLDLCPFVPARGMTDIRAGLPWVSFSLGNTLQPDREVSQDPGSLGSCLLVAELPVGTARDAKLSPGPEAISEGTLDVKSCVTMFS